MAYTLKASGIATNLIECLAVDSDGSTVKAFVSSDTNSNMTRHANVVTGTSSWKGVSRGYFQTLGSGTSPQCIEFPSGHRPVWNVTGVGGAGDGGSLFVAVAAAGAPSDNVAGGLVMDDNGKAVLGRDPASGSGYLKLYTNGGGSRVGDSEVAPIDGTTKWAGLCNFSTFDSPGWWIYHGLESASDLTLDTSGNDGGTATNINITGIGGWNGFGSWPAKFHIVALFNKTLDATERESLFDDWFGTLFDAGSSGPVTVAASGSALTPGTGTAAPVTSIGL